MYASNGSSYANRNQSLNQIKNAKYNNTSGNSANLLFRSDKILSNASKIK